jgi:spore coat polysaccharide biosynthesis protein SpsF
MNESEPFVPNRQAPPADASADPLKNLPFVAIIQARMGSNRLPGKVLLDIAGQPMLAHVVERTRQVKGLRQVVVATTTDPADQQIVDFCVQRGYPYYRGSLHDVLDRYYQTARHFQAGAIIRLTGDCPLIDPEVIEYTMQAFLRGPAGPEGEASISTFDFACNRLPPPWRRTFPIGLDVEICTFQALERAWIESSQPYHREHVMPFLYEEGRSIHYTIKQGKDNTPRPLPRTASLEAGCQDPFKVLVIDHEPDYGHLRWTVDTPEDLETVRKIFSGLDEHRLPDTAPSGERGAGFSWSDVIRLLEREPELSRINSQARAKDYREAELGSKK